MQRDALPQTMHVFERGWLSSNNVLFDEKDCGVLVDSGYATHAPQTLALVRHVLGERPLSHIINTHLHADHCGGNAALHDRYRCRISVPEGDAAAVREWNEEALSFRATGQQCPRFPITGTISAGHALTLGGLQWEALSAPGHDAHALILYCAEEGLLISGDALWENGFGIIFPELDGESGFAEARATLELIRELDVRLVIPGHGRPFAGVSAALDIARSRLDYLAAQPLRNAEHAVKALFKFLLLERKRITLTEATDLMEKTPLFLAMAQRHLHRTPAQLVQWTVEKLVRAGVARLDGQTIVDMDSRNAS